ncbi:unnamed protein product [Triticum turgidum subsp. durum]|uniref:Uncharacterized protein n=1 Tax=Triticum turgidum subsp. durum TaxID=4567 RepID=A0A9R0V2F6_TRITD|nr:unnamed protein product [Triticum turgidum subsp. durum]
MLPILPTPPRSKMLPLLPTPHGLVLTMLVSAMAGRADFVQRWDWNKKCKNSSSSSGSESTDRADSVERWDWNKKCKKPCGSICSSSSSSSEGSGSTGRADSVDRWNSDKKYKKPRTAMSSSSSSSYSSGSPGRADSVERWDSKKKLATSCSASLPTDLGRHDDNNKRLPSPSRASSVERWDLHKKPRPEQMEKLPRTNNAAATTPVLATTPQKAMFAGSNFHASPDPSMLPMPPFFLLARSRALCTSH